ncbi:hypothetical protein P6709_20435, partial [Jeotgalibacillus sp. ET6]|nr:hypothetical protein [Jeotgalibacillus sp. ET6]
FQIANALMRLKPQILLQMASVLCAKQFIGYHMGNEELIEEFDKHLEEMQEDGSISSIDEPIKQKVSERNV